MVAAWFGGSMESADDVEIYLSHHVGGKWSEPVSVANGIQYEGKRYACWNPVLFRMPEGGPLVLFYKVGASPSSWWGEYKLSYDGGYTWSDAVRLPEGILGPIKNKPFMTSDGRLICPSSTEESPNGGWHVHFEVTNDICRSWAKSENVEDPDNVNAIQPCILDHGDGILQSLARSLKGEIVTSWSCDNGRNWGTFAPLGLPNPNSGIDAVTLKNGLHVLVYNNAEKPAGKWSGNRNPMNLAVSVDGTKWYDVVELDRLDKDDKSELSYPAVVQGDDGLIHITYTYRRERITHVVVDPEDILAKHPEIAAQLSSRKPEATAAPGIIFDTDMGNDVDDVLALAMLYNYQKQGKANLLGITISKANPKAVPFISAFDYKYTKGKTPLGYIGPDGPTPDEGKYLSSVADAKNRNGKCMYKRLLNDASEVPEAYKLQRKLLASQPDQSVVIIMVGFASNLSRLLASGPDEYSPLNGKELVRRKVKLLSVMGGNFRHLNKSEFNIVKDIASAQYVFDNCPAPMIVGGWEVGGYVKYPCSSITGDLSESHPMRVAYSSYLPMPYDRECWDLISVQIAVEGVDGDALALSPQGRVSIDDTGKSKFVQTINGNQQILILNHNNIPQLQDALVKIVIGK